MKGSNVKDELQWATGTKGMYEEHFVIIKRLKKEYQRSHQKKTLCEDDIGAILCDKPLRGRLWGGKKIKAIWGNVT